MQTASHGVVGTSVGSRLWRSALGVLVVAFLAIVAYGAVTSVREAKRLDDRRAYAEATRLDSVLTAGESAEAFRGFRQSLGASSRFALVFGPAVDRDQQGFFRLFAGYYLYPAIAVDDFQEADAVMVFGRPPKPVLDSFERLGERDGIWLGRRRTA